MCRRVPAVCWPFHDHHGTEASGATARATVCGTLQAPSTMVLDDYIAFVRLSREPLTCLESSLELARTFAFDRKAEMKNGFVLSADLSIVSFTVACRVPWAQL